MIDSLVFWGVIGVGTAGAIYALSKMKVKKTEPNIADNVAEMVENESRRTEVKNLTTGN